MGSEGRVVVVVRPRIFASEVPGRYAAEILELGLGAYGATPEDAQRKLIAMFAGAVQARRQLGRLAAWLERSGLEWYWAADYRRDIPVLNADGKDSALTSGPRELGMAA